jgi:hypothetical protein
MKTISQPKASVTLTMTKEQASVIADFLRTGVNIDAAKLYYILPLHVRLATMKGVIATLDDLLDQDEENHLGVPS